MGGESYLVGFIGFLAFVILFLVLLQLPTKIGWFVQQILTGLIVHILTTIFGFMIVNDFSYWYQASLYAFLWFCFFFVSSIYSASVSVGIISYLYDQPQYTAPLDDVYQKCVVQVFEERVEFLIAMNQVQETDQGFISTVSGRNTANRLRLISKILGMESQGFYSSNSTLSNTKNSVDQV